MQYASPLGMGRPINWLMSDSNVDWNQALPEVEQFARERGLTDVPLDAYGFSDARPIVPKARIWDCQTPADSDAGHWVFLSANLMLDASNCQWVLQYEHEPLAHGGMYAVRLPASIPPAGAPGGPPAAGDRRIFLNGPMDMRPIFRELSDHPERMSGVMEAMVEKWRKIQEESQKKAGPVRVPGKLKHAPLGRACFSLPV